MKIEFEIEDTFPPVGFDFIGQMRLYHQLQAGGKGEGMARQDSVKLRQALQRIVELDKMPSRVEAATQMVELAKDALRKEKADERRAG